MTKRIFFSSLLTAAAALLLSILLVAGVMYGHLERAQRAQKEALERLESLKREDRDFSIAEAKLKRALARIHAKE